MSAANHDWKFTSERLTLAAAREAWNDAISQATARMGRKPDVVKVQLRKERRSSDSPTFETAMADLGLFGADKIDSIWPLAMWFGVAESALSLQLESAPSYVGWHVSGTDLAVADAIAEDLLARYPETSSASTASPHEGVSQPAAVVSLEPAVPGTNAHRLLRPLVSHPYWGLVVGLASLVSVVLAIAALR